jgi:hypothetical protein
MSKMLCQLTLLLTICTAAAAAVPVSRLTVDTSRHFQVMDNFGANDAWTMEPIGVEWSETNKERIADLLFSTNTGIGLSCWRFNLTAGINHETIKSGWRTGESFETAPGKYDWTRRPGQRWFLRAAKARGVTQFAATVYSPPLRLTRNGLSNSGGDTNSTTNLKPGAEDDFAQYLADILCHFRDDPDPAERIAFNYLIPVNEPQWKWQEKQEGCRYSNADLRRLYPALKGRLDTEGLGTKLLGPESGSIPDMYSLNQAASDRWHSDYGDYLRFICGDPQLAACFSGIITYHSYWSDKIPDEMAPRRAALGRAKAAYLGWRLWQSEYCIMESGRDLGMDAALRLARVIHCDLALAGASAWQWWLAVANGDYKDGLIYTDYKRPGDLENILPSKTFWTLGNYSRFIRPGMVRVGLSGPQNLHGLLATACLNPTTGQTVLVLVNNADTPQRIMFRFTRDTETPGTFTPYVTSATWDLAAGKPFIPAAGYLMESQSVVTLVGTNIEKRNPRRGVSARN